MDGLTLTWTRPDGEEAVGVVLTDSTPEEASGVLADLLDVLGDVRQGAQAQRQAVKDTVRGMEGQ